MEPGRSSIGHKLVIISTWVNSQIESEISQANKAADHSSHMPALYIVFRLGDFSHQITITIAKSKLRFICVIFWQAPALQSMKKMTVAEMRAELAKKKKSDPRKEKLSAKAKLDMFQKL